MEPASLIGLVPALALAPLLLGIINRTKAMFAGRRGAPLLQAYFDIAKLLRKGAVYSRTTTWVFRLGPIVGLAAVVVAVLLVPLGSLPPAVKFPGDLIVFAYLLGLARFVTVISALDTGSSFEGMGASREVLFAALAEPALLLGLAAIAHTTGNYSLSGMLGELTLSHWARMAPVLALVGVALMIVLVAETARIPVDDPNTHLELTMIHEVMILDHGGPDLAAILYGAALKLWLFGAILTRVLLPFSGEPWWLNLTLSLGAMFVLAIIIGVVESTMARLRLLVVPQLLVGAGALATVALILVLR